MAVQNGTKSDAVVQRPIDPPADIVFHAESFAINLPVSAKAIEMPQLPDYIRVRIRHLGTVVTFPVPKDSSDQISPTAQTRREMRLRSVDAKLVGLATEIAKKIVLDIGRGKQALAEYTQLLSTITPTGYEGPIRVQNLKADPETKRQIQALWDIAANCPVDPRLGSTGLIQFRAAVLGEISNRPSLNFEMTPEIQEQVVALAALYCVKSGRVPNGAMRRFPIGFFDPNEGSYLVRVATVLRHVLVDNLRVNTPQRLENFRSYSKSFPKWGLSDLQSQLSPLDMARIAFPGYVEGENPIIRDWKLPNVSDSENPYTLDVRIKRAAVWELKHGQAVVRPDGTVNMERLTSPRISWPKVLANGRVLGYCGTVQQFFDLAVPGLIGYGAGQVPPWKVFRSANWYVDAEGGRQALVAKQGAKQVLRSVIENEWGLVDVAGRLDVRALKSRPSLSAALNETTGFSVGRFALLFQKTYPLLIGFGRHQVLPLELNRGHGTKPDPIAIRQRACKELWLDGLGQFALNEGAIQWSCSQSDFAKWWSVKVQGWHGSLEPVLRSAFGDSAAYALADSRAQLFSLLTGQDPGLKLHSDKIFQDALYKRNTGDWRVPVPLGTYSQAQMQRSFGKNTPPMDAEMMLYEQLAESKIQLQEVKRAFQAANPRERFSSSANQFLPSDVPYAWAAYFAAAGVQAAERMITRRSAELARWFGVASTPECVAAALWGCREEKDAVRLQTEIDRQRQKIELSIGQLVSSQLYCGDRHPIEIVKARGVTVSLLKEELGIHPKSVGGLANPDEDPALNKVKALLSVAGLNFTPRQQVAWQLARAERSASKPPIERVIDAYVNIVSSSWNGFVRTQDSSLNPDAERHVFKQILESGGKDSLAWKRFDTKLLSKAPPSLRVVLNSLAEGATASQAVALWVSADGEDSPRFSKYREMLKFLRQRPASNVETDALFELKSELSEQRGARPRDSVPGSIETLLHLPGLTRAELLESARWIGRCLNEVSIKLVSGIRASRPLDTSSLIVNSGVGNSDEELARSAFEKNRVRAMSIFGVWLAGMDPLAEQDYQLATLEVKAVLTKIILARNLKLPSWITNE